MSTSRIFDCEVIKGYLYESQDRMRSEAGQQTKSGYYNNFFINLFLSREVFHFVPTRQNRGKAQAILSIYSKTSEQRTHVLKNFSVIKRCPLLEGSLTKIVTFETKDFVSYSRHVRYLGYPLLRGFAVNTSSRYTYFITQ